MTIRNRAALYDTTTTIHLPPFGPLRIEPRDDWSADIRPIPRSGASARGSKVLSSRPKGWRIDISGIYINEGVAGRVEDALVWEQTVREFLLSSGEAKEVQLCEWLDTDKQIKRIWRGCYQVGPFQCEPLNNSRRELKFTLPLFSEYPIPFSDFSDSTQPAAGAYEDYLFSSDSLDTVTPPAGTVTTTTVNAILPICDNFAGAAETATSANEGLMRRRYYVAQDAEIRRLKITGGQGWSGGGTSTVRVSDTDHGTAGNYLEASVAYNEEVSASAAGSFTVSAGDYIYVYVQSGGGHSDLQYYLEVHYT